MRRPAVWGRGSSQGKTFAETAQTERTSKHRVQDVIGLALLAPDFPDTAAFVNRPTALPRTTRSSRDSRLSGRNGANNSPRSETTSLKPANSYHWNRKQRLRPEIGTDRAQDRVSSGNPILQTPEITRQLRGNLSASENREAWLWAQSRAIQSGQNFPDNRENNRVFGQIRPILLESPRFNEITSIPYGRIP